MPKKILALLASTLTTAAIAGPLVGIEYESEKDRNSKITNQALSIIPGWNFAEDSPISRVELLIEHNRDDSAGAGGQVARENKLFVRLRHDGEVAENLDYFVRGGVGRAYNNSHRDYSYAYVEPGLEFKFAPRWEFVLAYRVIDAIDQTKGQRVNKVSFGPSFLLDEHNELEARFVRAHGDQSSSAILLEYVHSY